MPEFMLKISASLAPKNSEEETFSLSDFYNSYSFQIVSGAGEFIIDIHDDFFAEA